MRLPVAELYNVTSDPEYMNNLAEDPQFADLQASMKSSLFTALIRQGDPRMLGTAEIFDQCRPQRQKLYEKLVGQSQRKKK